jgi:dTDP-4-amino-4,6-dideoxygalactose transaminase
VTVKKAAAVPIADPHRAVVDFQAELSRSFERFLANGRYVLGPEHAAFEREFGDFVGVAHCAGVASGTDALELALIGVGCRAGETILTAANCGGYTTTAARRAGLRVRFADVDEITLGLSRSSVAAALSPDVRAVVVTHLYGLLADVEGIVELCGARGIAVVEDCAQAAGSERLGRRAGTFGDAGVFSFYPTKNLAALGDGGAVTTNSDEVAERVRLLRQYGWATKYEVSLSGAQNSRLDELQAGVLRLRLSRLDDWNARRRRIVERYGEALPPAIGRFVARRDEAYVAHLAVAVFEDRERARAKLEGAEIGTDVHYPIADHQQPAWRHEYADVSLPVTENAVHHVLTVPCFPELTEEEIERVCEVLNGL